ncbi:MAG: DDE-type integrase/transposase/recombinase [Algiphilus sp.]|uniref:Mu transposase C-terminal domain-containing protein n=1 Tax=Algiphilus sp. TaxID=1872431 RepID=UPI0032F08DA0
MSSGSLQKKAELAEQHLVEIGYAESTARALAAMLATSTAPRSVGNSFAENTRVRFPSMKMGITMVCESFSLEYGLCCQLEYDPKVLWYITQPTTLNLTITRKNGVRAPTKITPDFLVITADRAYFVETKPDGLVRKKSEASSDWVEGKLDEWRYLPGENNEFGLDFHVVTDKHISRRFIENIEHFHGLASRRESPRPEDLEQLSQTVSAHGELTLHDLVTHYQVSKTEVLWALKEGVLFWLPDIDQLSAERRCRIFASPELAAAARRTSKARGLHLSVGGRISFAGTNYQILGLTESTITIHNDSVGIKRIPKKELSEHDVVDAPPQRSQLASFREQDLRVALQRLELIKLWSPPKRPPARKRASYYRWKKKYDEAEEHCGNGLIGLIPNYKDRGKQQPDLSEEVIRLMADVADKFYFNKISPTLRSAYEELCLRMREYEAIKKHPVPSYETFRRYTRDMRSHSDAVSRREGRRLSNQVRPTLAQSEGVTPIRGKFPWHIVECDHTKLDLLLKDENGNAITSDTWITVMLDQATRYPLAWLVTAGGEERSARRSTPSGGSRNMNTPSAVRTASLIRELIYRHERLPIRLHLDNGADFRSTLIETFLSSHGVTLSNRAPGNPRRGSTIESFFKVMNDRLLAKLGGSKRLEGRNPRQVSKSHRPDSHARYTLAEAQDIIDNWLLEEYIYQEHTGIQRRPYDAYNEGMADLDASITLSLSEQTNIALAPEVGTRVIQKGKGVKYDNYYYWMEQFDTDRLIGKKVRVKSDTWDRSKVYVLIDRLWHEAIAEFYRDFQELEEIERRVASEEARIRRFESEKRKRNDPPSLIRPDRALYPAKSNSNQSSIDRSAASRSDSSADGDDDFSFEEYFHVNKL